MKFRVCFISVRLLWALTWLISFSGLNAPRVHAQIVDQCAAAPTLANLIADLAEQNLSSQADFWGADQTQIQLLLSSAGAQTLQVLQGAQTRVASNDLRDLIQAVEGEFDLPLPDGGVLLPSLRVPTDDERAVELKLLGLLEMDIWVDAPFDVSRAAELPAGDLAAALSLWAQTRAYAGDAAALEYVQTHSLTLPRPLRSQVRFRPNPSALTWTAEDLHRAVFAGHLTWVEAENIIWGWFAADDRIRAQAFAQDLRRSLIQLRGDFVAGRPDFEAEEPFSGYFSSWQRWEDLAARLLLMLGRRSDVPAGFFHQTLALGLGETEPNVAALDVSQLFAAWHAQGYQPVADAAAILTAQRSATDVAQVRDTFSFFQILVLGSDLGRLQLQDILNRLEGDPQARWIGGPLLMQAFLTLDEPALALRAAAVAAKSDQSAAPPYDYVLPLVRMGQADLARQVLATFYLDACTRVSLRSERTYAWIDWLPLLATVDWQVPVNRFDGI